MKRALALLLPVLLIACSPAAPAAPAAKPAASAPTGAPAATSAPVAQAATSAPAAKPAALQTINVAYIPLINTAPVYVAIEKGYFAEQGIESRLEQFTNGNDMLTQLSSDRVDIVYGAGVNAWSLNAMSSGLDVRVFTTGHADFWERISSPLMTRVVNGQPLAPTDLRAKKVAVNGLGVSAEFMAAEALRENGLSIDEVDLTQLPFPDILVALSNGGVDAGLQPEPFRTMAVQRGVAAPVAFKRTGILQGTVSYISPSFLQNKRDLAQRWTVAFLKGVRDLQGDGYVREDVDRIIAKYTQLEAELVRATIPSYWDPDGRVNVESLMEQQRYHIARGSVKLREPLDLQPYIDETLITYAVQQLGPYKP